MPPQLAQLSHQWWFAPVTLAVVAVFLTVAFLFRGRRSARKVADLEEQLLEKNRELLQANRELLVAQRALEEARLVDAATGLRNRRFLLEHLEGDVALAVRRYEGWLSDRSLPRPIDADVTFFLLDIDEIKTIHDTYGRTAGDRVLAEVGRRLRDLFRDSDYLVRWNGDQFLGVARGLKREEAPMIAERLRAAVADRPIQIDGGTRLSRTCAVGFASFPFIPERPRGLDWSAVVTLAEHAVSCAREAGSDRWMGIVGGDQHVERDALSAVVSEPAEAVRRGRLKLLSAAGPAR